MNCTTTDSAHAHKNHPTLAPYDDIIKHTPILNEKLTSKLI